MPLSVECSFSYQVLSPTAHFTFNILAGNDAQQRLLAEQLSFKPEMPLEKVTTSKGNRVVRVEAPAGEFDVRYTATIELLRPPLPAEVKPDNPGRLHLSILTYMLPSR